MRSINTGPNQSLTTIQNRDSITDQELLVYPLWGRLIAPESKTERANATQRLQGTLSRLERVQRQGSPEEARKAGVIAAAFKTVLALLAEIEQELA